MKIELLTSAMDDLAHGRLFYENQGKGLGDYFLDSLFSDIDSLFQVAIKLTWMGCAIAPPILRKAVVGWVECNGTHQCSVKISVNLKASWN